MRALVPLLVAAAVAACGSESTVREPDPEPGAACETSADCHGLACIDDARFPDGYCSSVCAEDPCMDGSRCVDGYGAPLCLVDCAGSEDCRGGYQCWMGTCRPECTEDTECGIEGARCEDSRCTGTECTMDEHCGPGRRCVANRCMDEPMVDAGPGMLPVGAECTLPAQCETGICLPPAQGGVCAEACIDRESCGDVNPCSPVAMDSDGDGEGDTVVTACVESDPSGRFLAGRCGSDDRCESRSCVRSQCAEACDDDGDCLAGQTCREVSWPGLDQTYVGCWYRNRGGPASVQDFDLGVSGASTGLPSSRVNFAIPNDAVSVTLMAERSGGDDLPYAFINVWDPRNDSLFDYTELVEWVDQPDRWIPINSYEHITMLVPNSTPDRLNLRGGRHGFTVAALADGMGGSGSSTLELGIRVKRARRGEVSSGTLDLNVFLVGVGLSPSEARSDSRLQGALGRLDSILSAVGVGLGMVDYFEITAGGLAVIDSSGDPDSEMARLLRMSEGRDNDAINVFLVRGISRSASESGGIALGVAGGIPGPPGVHGTMHSGVLVSFDPSVVGTGTDGERVIAQIAAHEIGHYLGLFHNREQASPCPDGTGPTMSDPCAPFGGEDPISDTGRGDGRNLMWFALGGADGRTYNIRLTDGQGFVMLRHAVVQP